MKEKLYIQTQNNGDILSQKLNKFNENDNTSTLFPNLQIYNTMKYGDLITKNATGMFDTFMEVIIKPANLEKLYKEKAEKKIIDASNHSIRYASLLSTLLINIINKENAGNEDLKKQIKAKFHALDKSNITQVGTSWEKYYKCISSKEIALVKIADRGRDYIKYYDILIKTTAHIKSKISKGLRGNEIPGFCPFESILLQYMLDIKSNGTFSDITINDLYNIVDIYKYSYQKNTNGHDNCLCNSSFSIETPNVIITDTINKLKEYLHEHFDKVKYIQNSIDSFHEKYPAINWLYQHVVKYNGHSTQFKLWKQFTLIGYDADKVIIAYIKPQLNDLNYNEVLMNSIYDTYLIENIEKYEMKEDIQSVTENYKRFANKKIITCVFALDRNEPYYINWTDNDVNLIESNSNLLKTSMCEYVFNHFSSENNSMYYFYNYWRRNCPNEHAIADKFTEFLLSKYEDIKAKGETDTRKFPTYLYSFLHSINAQVSINDDTEEQDAILAKYDNKEYFIKALDSKLDVQVKLYFNIKDVI